MDLGGVSGYKVKGYVYMYNVYPQIHSFAFPTFPPVSAILSPLSTNLIEFRVHKVNFFLPV